MQPKAVIPWEFRLVTKCSQAMWGSNFSNALGLGLFFDYGASDDLELELGWINSTHAANSPIINGTTINNSFNLVDNSVMLDLQWDFRNL